MSAFSSIKVIDEGQCVSLVLDRPPLNVMNIAMIKEINTALEELQRNATAKVLILRAEGKAFSAGVDVADHTPDRVEEMMALFCRTFELLHAFTIPTVAAVDGAALGGGCELATFCDMVIASERAKFGQPEIKVGVFPPVAAVLFPRLIGRNRALELLMSGETISAAEAERVGLINKVFPVEGFEKSVTEFVTRFTNQSKIILEMTKRAIDDGLGRGMLDAIEMAQQLYMGKMMKTEDAHEGLQAFLEKRTPVWKNK